MEGPSHLVREVISDLLPTPPPISSSTWATSQGDGAGPSGPAVSWTIPEMDSCKAG